MMDLDLCETEDVETRTSHAGWVMVNGKRLAAKMLPNGSVEYRWFGKNRTADADVYSTFSYDGDAIERDCE